MAKPEEYKPTAPIDARLVTKTSLPRPKQALALLLILWYSNGRPSLLEYGSDSGDTKNGGIFSESILNSVQQFASNEQVRINESDLRGVLPSNPLCTSQIESLNAAFELVWHLASFSFANGKPLGAERTGGLRFRKVIAFSSGIDLIDIVASGGRNRFAAVLLSWLTGKKPASALEAENALIRALTLLTEHSYFKTSKGAEGTVFIPSGIYAPLLRDAEKVEIVDPGAEAQGPTRILKSILSDNLCPYLLPTGNGSARLNPAARAELPNYYSRVLKGLELSNVNPEDRQTAQSENSRDECDGAPRDIDEPHNLIFFGAPGTGKSHNLNELSKQFPKGNVRRVTFYPDYTYSQFVGCFKPITDEVTDGEGGTKASITYRYVFGPFLETYLEAAKNPDENYLLIVEEINRANPAAVFGDVFQLLDRKDTGESQYSVVTPEEMRKQLVKELEGFPVCAETLSIPKNMYIWATMNSSDQGVYPMDTAFKRRWDFRYMGIDAGEKAIINGKSLSEIVVTCGGRKVYWNELRKAINKLMVEDCGINEDKLLGPFFLNPSSLTEENFCPTFKEKVLLYLFEDAGKTKRSRLFWQDRVTYSQLCDKFDEDGEGVFANGLDDTRIFADEDDAIDSEVIGEE